MKLTRREALAGAAVAALTPAVARADDTEERAKAALVAVLRLEQAALVGYEAIANGGVLTATLRGFLDQEREHAAQLEKALQDMGAKPPIPPRRAAIPGLDAALASRARAARFAIALELRTVAAYQGAIRFSRDPNLVRTASGAMGTDAQQLVVFRELAGEAPLPRAFETGHRP